MEQWLFYTQVFELASRRKYKSISTVTRIRTWVTAATTQGPNH